MTPSPNLEPDPATAAHPRRLTIAILGLGEVGRTYGAALAEAGHRVTGFDPYLQSATTGVELADSLAEAVGGAEIVFTLTAASASRAVAEATAGAMLPEAVYADFTSSGPAEKQALKEIFAGRRPDVRLVDVAILGPVIQLGTATPLMAAGPGAEAVAAVMRPLGTPVEVIDGSLGDAMAHKLLRSVFMKGLASVVVEAVSAGREAGMEDWIRHQIAGVLAGDGQAVIDRFLTGTRKHAPRRSMEMRATGAYLADLGVPSEMTDASATALERIAAEATAAHRSAN